MSNFLKAFEFLLNRKSTKWTLGFVYISTLIIHLLNTKFDNDELEHMHATWLVGQGFRPFSDFVEQHNPFIWYAFSPALKLFNDDFFKTVTFFRLFDLALLLIILAVIYKGLKLYFSESISFLSVFLLASNVMFVHHAIEFRPDPLMTTFIVISFYNLARYFKTQQSLHLALSGFCIGFASVVLQKALLFLGLEGLCLGLYFILNPFKLPNRKKTFLDILLFVTFSLILILLFMVFSYKYLVFEDYWFWNFEFNSFFYLNAEVHHHFNWHKKIIQNLAECFLIWPLFILGSVLAIKKFKPHFLLFGFTLIAWAYLLAFTQNRFPLSQYLLPLFPLMIYLCANALEWIEANSTIIFRWIRFWIGLTHIVFLIVLLNYPNNKSQLNIINKILEHTTKNQTIFVQPPYHPVFRADASYFWYNNGPIKKALKDYEEKYQLKTKWFEQDLKQWQLNPPHIVFYEEKLDFKFFEDTKSWFEHYKDFGFPLLVQP